MAYYLPSSSAPSTGPSPDPGVHTSPGRTMADLKVFWGPDICRLEYLMHLLDTGRIKDEAVVREQAPPGAGMSR